MAVSETPKSITIRVEPGLYAAATRIARKRSVSLNALVNASLAAVIRAEEEQLRFEAYTRLAEDHDACDVDYAASAQAEVMLHDEP